MKKLIACLSVLGILLVSCAPAGDDGTGPIRIGFIGPLTGDAAAYGVDTLNGVQIKVDELNAAGGVKGRMIELIAEDGRCTGTDSASAAQKLINVDKVVAIVGGQCSGETLAIAPIAESAGIVEMSPLSSSPDVTAAGDYIFRDYPSDALKTKAMAKYFKDKEFKNVAVITENTDFAQGFRTTLKTDFGDFVFDEVVEPGTKDYRSLVTRLKSVDFDVFLANGQSPATIAAMVMQLREQGLEQVVITHDAGQAQDTIDVGGDATEGLLAINVPSLGDTTAFGKAYLAKYGAPQSSLAFAGHAYDAMGILAQVIGAVGTDGAAMRDYLYDMTPYKGVVGDISFDDNGDVVGVNYKLIEVQDGAWVELQDMVVE